MNRQVFILAPESRKAAIRAVSAAPEGYKVTIAPQGRTLDQNAMLWPILECFSYQKKWPVNGAMVSLEPEEWKDILTAAFRQETVRLAQGLSGGMVMLGCRTSRMNKKEFSEFLEFALATAEEYGVET